MEDMERVQAYALKVWQAKQGEMVSLMIELGERLGLFSAIATHPASTAEELSSETGLHGRPLQEWLYGMAAADLLDYDDGRFSLPQEANPILVDGQESLFFAAGVFRGSFRSSMIDAIVGLFRTGRGSDAAAFGDEMAETVEQITGPFNRLALVPFVLAQLGNLTERLAAGGKVADVGGGTGMAGEAVARAFPDTDVVVVDLSEPAVHRGRKRAGDVANLEFRLGRAEEIDDGPYDLMMALDCLHDMPRPDLGLAAMRANLASDGVVLVKELRSSGSFEANRRNPLLSMFYGYSLMSCLLSGMSTDDGWGLGNTGLHPAALEALAEEHGLGSVRRLDVPDPGNLYYSLMA
jgi:SAM-dependent methyltransferase